MIQALKDMQLAAQFLQNTKVRLMEEIQRWLI